MPVRADLDPSTLFAPAASIAARPPATPSHAPARARIRLRFTARFKIDPALVATWLKTLEVTLAPQVWDTFRPLLIEYYYFATLADVDTTLKKIAGATVGNRQATGQRYYVSASLAAHLRQFREPGEVVEVAYRMHEVGHDINKLKADGTAFILQKIEQLKAKLKAEAEP